MYETTAAVAGRPSARSADEARAIEGAIQGVREAAARTGTLIERTRDLADRLFGERPKLSTSGDDRSTPPRAAGEVAELQEAIGVLHYALNDLEQQVGRLTPSL